MTKCAPAKAVFMPYMTAFENAELEYALSGLAQTESNEPQNYRHHPPLIRQSAGEYKSNAHQILLGSSLLKQ